MDGKIFLVVFHRGRQDFFGDLEILAVERAVKRHGVLDEIKIFLNQGGIEFDGAVKFFFDAGNGGAHFLFALFLVDNDPVVVHDGQIVVA